MVQIKHEIQKLMDVDFIEPIQHLTWLANIVPFRKKIGLATALTFVTSTKHAWKMSYSC